MGTVSFVMGEFKNAHRFCKQGVDLYDPAQHGELAFVYGADPAVVSRLYSAKALWMLGYPTQAQEEMGAALSHTTELSHGHTQAFALCYQATLHQYCQDAHSAYETAETAVKVASEHGIRQWLAWGTIVLGWALAILHKQKEGIARIQEGLDNWREKELFCVRYFLYLKAEVLATLGRLDEGIETLDGAIKISDEGSQRFYLAELYRLKGDLLLKQSIDQYTNATACYKKALNVARDQEAKSLELRTIISLNRIGTKRGREKDTRKDLKKVYGWFSEGFDTRDLHEAKTLADRLP